ncbi:MAG TPA: AraC family transcriptional regulator [Chitinophagaceae bacterium]
MNQFVLSHNSALELRLFPHILEIGVIKNPAIRLNGFPRTIEKGLKIYYILEGKFEWCICKHPFILYPGDAALVLPGSELGNAANVLEIGSFSWIHIQVGMNEREELVLGSWSSLSDSENQAMSKVLKMDHPPILQKFSDAGVLLKNIQTELTNQEIGYQARVNHLLDEIFIQVARQYTRISNPGRDFPKTFMKLEQELRRNLSHQWTVEEMASLVGLGTTLFNEKVKSYSGFSPLSYLINIRISEAIKMLKRPDINLTDIALDTGFYSSQHFSTTFKKLTGYTPSEFRKNHL